MGILASGCSPQGSDSRTGQGADHTKADKEIAESSANEISARDLAGNPVEEIRLLANPGFEAGLENWVLHDESGASAVTAEAAHSGSQGARIRGQARASGGGKPGTTLLSSAIPIDTALAYRLTFHARVLSGSGVSVSLKFFDEKGRLLKASPGNNALSVQAGNQWRPWSVTALPPTAARTMKASVWVKPGQNPPATADFDDFKLVSFKPSQEAPWPPRYKIRPDEKNRLTASDVVGPDGLVYPNWRNTGIAGGIPALPVVVGPENFAGLEGTDIVNALKKAIEQASSAGGGAIQLPAGVFYLDRPVFITRSGVVIKGAGRDATRLVFRARVPYGTVQLYQWGDEKKFGPGATVEFWANPKDLACLEMKVNGHPFRTENRRDHWGNRFNIVLPASALLERTGPGLQKVEVTARYGNGDSFTKEFPLTVVTEPVRPLAYGQAGAIILAGGGHGKNRKIPLAATADRGSLQLKLNAGHGLLPGDRIEIEAPATPRWNQLVGNQAPWGAYRINQYQITKADSEIVTIDRPLRIEFPMEDGSFVRKIEVITRSGIEALTIEQPVITQSHAGPKIRETLWYPIEDLWMNGVLMNYAWECWARDIRIVNAGRSPLYTINSRSCEIRDSEFDDVIFKGGGGSGYVGFERSFDCLMENVVTRNMRHAPDVQWGAAGNVFRNSKFYGSDGQWHAGWTHENLFEGNLMKSKKGDPERNGGYGFGLFASGPSVPTHGPQGPRNVVYANDIFSPKDGIVMRGGNEGWLILHNRFHIDEGQAVRGGEKGFDHIIRNNVFVMKSPRDPAVLFTAPDNVGMELIGNRFYGNINRIAGFGGAFGKLASDEDNTVEPYNADAPRPLAEPPSIYLWQQNNRSTSAMILPEKQMP